MARTKKQHSSKSKGEISQPCETLEYYFIEKVIGRGGFSKVMQVRHKITGLMYAMKVLRKDKIKLDNKVEQIMTERRILEKVNHPFLVSMHSAFESVSFLCSNIPEILPTSGSWILPWWWALLLSSEMWKILRKDSKVLLCLDPPWTWISSPTWHHVPRSQGKIPLFLYLLNSSLKTSSWILKEMYGSLTLAFLKTNLQEGIGLLLFVGPLNTCLRRC